MCVLIKVQNVFLSVFLSLPSFLSYLTLKVDYTV